MLKDVATGQIVKTPEGHIYRVTLSPYYESRANATCIKGEVLQWNGEQTRRTFLRLDSLELAEGWIPETEETVAITDLPKGVTVLISTQVCGSPYRFAGTFERVLKGGKSPYCQVGSYDYRNYEITYARVGGAWKRVLG